ncbi:MAG: DUF3150 domain-containing protein [Desulforegulaceae bacterium]|nr:DUF3150 domain-containing protein [Desulforegulaceae bacterium]
MLNNKKLICVNVSVSMWAGKKVIRPEDLGLDSAELPPQKLANFGQKKVCNPEDLRDFARIRQQTFHSLEQTGVKFLGGFAFPLAKAGEVKKMLELKREEFLQSKQLFLQKYETSLQTWLEGFPEKWREIIHPEKTVDIAEKFRFTFSFFQIQAPPGFENEVEAMFDDLAENFEEEIKQEASELWEKYFQNRAEITARPMEKFRKLLEKAMSLVFLKPSLGPNLKRIDDELVKLPDGKLTGSEAFTASGLIMELMNLAPIATSETEETEDLLDSFESPGSPSPEFEDWTLPEPSQEEDVDSSDSEPIPDEAWIFGEEEEVQAPDWLENQVEPEVEKQDPIGEVPFVDF